MRYPVIQDSIYHGGKRTKVLGREGIDDRLTMVIRAKKNKPGETEKENDAIED
jgi:hypothetical protein